MKLEETHPNITHDLDQVLRALETDRNGLIDIVSRFAIRSFIRIPDQRRVALFYSFAPKSLSNIGIQPNQYPAVLVKHSILYFQISDLEFSTLIHGGSLTIEKSDHVALDDGEVVSSRKYFRSLLNNKITNPPGSLNGLGVQTTFRIISPPAPGIFLGLEHSVGISASDTSLIFFSNDLREAISTLPSAPNKINANQPWLKPDIRKLNEVADECMHLFRGGNVRRGNEILAPNEIKSVHNALRSKLESRGIKRRKAETMLQILCPTDGNALATDKLPSSQIVKSYPIHYPASLIIFNEIAKTLWEDKNGNQRITGLTTNSRARVPAIQKYISEQGFNSGIASHLATIVNPYT
jgi:hypothetical protein